MFLVGQRVNRRNPTVFGKLLNIRLSKGSYHCAMNHPAQDPSGIDDRFSSAQLNVVLRKKDDASSQFTNANFKTDSRSGRRFTENQGPCLPGRRTGSDVLPRSALNWLDESSKVVKCSAVCASIERKCFIGGG